MNPAGPAPTTPPAGRWRVVLLAFVVCVQVGVPVWATSRGVPHKLGFHMFTGHEGMTVTVTDGRGEPVPVDLGDWIVVKRQDIDWVARLAPAICRDTPDAAEVVVRQWGEDEVYSC